MKEYLKLLIVLVTLVSISLVILPEGKMKKTTCICFSFVICLTLLSPIKNFVLEEVFIDNSVDYNYSLEDDYRQGIYTYIIKTILTEEGIKVEEVFVEFDYNDLKKIKKISIKLDKTVLKDEAQHINIIVKAKECLSERLNISFSEIVVYE